MSGRHDGNAAYMLLLASMRLPAARQLGEVAARRGWRVCALDEGADVRVVGERCFFGGTDRVREHAERYELCLVEPPVDLLARVPRPLRGREVRLGTLAKLRGVAGPVFVKPADPIEKSFDAGVYRAVAEVSGRRPLRPETPVIVSEAVEWTSEFRCFVREGRVEAWSPYLSYGRPTWNVGCAGTVPGSLEGFCRRLVGEMRDALPPAFVVDVGVMEDGRWAVVEFNPAWCSSVLGADAERVLPVVQRSAMFAAMATEEDWRWVRVGRRGAGRGLGR